jgi:hypothetical protein
MKDFKTMAEVMAEGNPENTQLPLFNTIDELDRIISALKSIRDSIAIASKPMSK